MGKWAAECEMRGEWDGSDGRGVEDVIPVFAGEINRLGDGSDAGGRVACAVDGGVVVVRMEVEAGSAGEAFLALVAGVNRAAGAAGMARWPFTRVRITQVADVGGDGS